MAKQPKVKNWDLMSRIGSSAPLKENGQNSAPAAETPTPAAEPVPTKPVEGPKVQRKMLAAMPTEYVEAHEQLRESGRTAMNLSSYIYEAVREKLVRDGAFEAKK
ncbi:molecular chaperone GroEL [Enterobacter hormaechei]|uniref:molecular chaperone GroEL n=1 Tax=Enterobacter hormaechei TaxID=158836 RepID=UPI003C2B0068